MNKQEYPASLRAHLARRRRRRWLVLTIGLIAVVWAVIMLVIAGLGTASYYRTPSEITAADRLGHVRLRLGGYVEKGTVAHGAATEVHFEVTDCQTRQAVVFNGILPDLFREGQGVIAEGQFVDGRFVASEVLAKHDERYIPKEIAGQINHSACGQEPEKP